MDKLMDPLVGDAEQLSGVADGHAEVDDEALSGRGGQLLSAVGQLACLSPCRIRSGHDVHE